MQVIGRARRLVGCTLVAALLTTAARAAAPSLPPLITAPDAEQHVGKMIFVELSTPDLPGSEKFYGGLFGWSFRAVTFGTAGFAQASVAGEPVAGLIQRELPARSSQHPAWLAFFAVQDAAATVRLAAQHGAKVLFTPHSAPDLREEAVLADPQGAVFAILASSSGDPPDELAAPGAWIWSSLLAPDPDAEAAFYQTVFGYDVYPLPAATDAGHLILGDTEYARASVNKLPGEGHARWLNYLRVDDADAMVAKVIALGGRVLVPPHPDRHGGKVAVVADPLGAPFGLMEWQAATGPDARK